MDRLSPLTAYLAAALIAFGAGVIAAQDDLVPRNARWRYLDDGSDLGAAWRATDFDDAAWGEGRAELGYGDFDEATVIEGGPLLARRITTYLRHAFWVDEPASYHSLELLLLRDDGAAVYLNGAEVWRSNLPEGALTAGTRASTTVSGAEESAFHLLSLSPSLLAPGRNVLAVEVHQASPTSSDVSFDLELDGIVDPSVRVTRGPYLQLATPTSLRVRWRTDAAVPGAVRYWEAAGTGAPQIALAPPAIEHDVELTGLVPGARYVYSVGTAAAALRGGREPYTFRHAPPPGRWASGRVWVLGDAGTGSPLARRVRNAFTDLARPPGDSALDLVLMLGDNAYEDGTDSDFQRGVFDVYQQSLAQSPVWPAFGNHDARSADAASESGPYFEIFTLPRAGEAGGVASGTEAFYSFDWGNVHFVCLDSSESDRDPGSPMLTWLASDLAASNADWVIAYWHHPPYSRGSHHSDLESELIEMRLNVLPVLEQHGVDLVLTGHSHAYERSFLLDGHYGPSFTLTPAMVLDAGDGDPAGDGPYRKPPGRAARAGAVYVVAGSSGKLSPGTLDHPAMVTSLLAAGSLVLDAARHRLDVRFLDEAGELRDRFQLQRGHPDLLFFDDFESGAAAEWGSSAP